MFSFALSFCLGGTLAPDFQFVSNTVPDYVPCYSLTLQTAAHERVRVCECVWQKMKYLFLYAYPSRFKSVKSMRACARCVHLCFSVCC